MILLGFYKIIINKEVTAIKELKKKVLGTFDIVLWDREQ